MSREVMQQALDALQDAESSLSDYQQDVPFGGYDARTIDCVRAAITAAEAALAAAQEPVARVVFVDEYGPRLEWTTHWVDLIGADLYASSAAPAPAEPTEEQIKLLDPWMRPAAAKELLTQVLALRDGGAA